ncbi:hypothetical protein MKZ38_000378 [Zalerion maritima]|uniref:HpcH/HpaI aldolase/citrate lyase domain-containing protein n=1 Tax=Zalerion maritima TaxID=339359 RepID=A0AAD5WTR3_9PEZI|nr:hypothetical protein MKZ38_000378 [Zalerion maritima]
MLLKSSSFNVDTIIYDLEDSVQDNQTATRLALKNLDRFLHGNLQEPPPPFPAVKELAIRIPSTTTPQNYFSPFRNFQTFLSPPERVPNPSHRRNHLSFVIPKIRSAFDVELVVRAVGRIFPVNRSQVSLILLIENAAAVQNIGEITALAKDSEGLINGLIFGAEDFAADVGMTRSESLGEFAYARSAIVTAAAAAGIPSVIDLVTLEHTGDNQDLAKLEREATNGRALGFTGKQVIHPNQVPVVQGAFSPSRNLINWATDVVKGWENAKFDDKGGSFSLGGQMMDRPMVSRARNILEHAVLCGIDIASLRGSSSTTSHVSSKSSAPDEDQRTSGEHELAQEKKSASPDEDKANGEAQTGELGQ